MKYLVKGEIHVDLFLVNSNELPEMIVVDVLDGDGVETRIASAPDGVTDVAIYDYSIWANHGQKVTFIPRDSRNVEKKFLFYPSQYQVEVAHDGCLAPVPAFTGRLGLDIEGSVSPPISGVNMKIIAAGDSQSASLKKGELALETSTRPDGVFIAGPLYDDISYTAVASKHGYHLKSVGPNSFSFSRIMCHQNRKMGFSSFYGPHNCVIRTIPQLELVDISFSRS